MKLKTVKFKIENRQSVGRLSKSGFNGGDSVPVSAAEERQVSLAAAYHISCTPALELEKAALSRRDHNRKTDPIYANCSEAKDLVLENMQLREMVVSHLDMIGQLQEELANNTRQVYPLYEGNEKLAARVVRRERRMCLMRYQEKAPPVLATRYFGRKSKTIPSRALKRRYMGPPKALHSTQPPPVPEEPPFRVAAEEEDPGLKRRPSNADHLATDREYFLPEPLLPEVPTPPHIDVPLWKLKPVTSFYQMEGTENINDPVFERRHQKYELDERRRKRWDLQRLREQRARMQKKRERGDGNPASFFPDPQDVEYIEVTDHLPVLAFGHPIPLFQPCEFSLPWSPEKNCVAKGGRRGRPPSTLT